MLFGSVSRIEHDCEWLPSTWRIPFSLNGDDSMSYIMHNDAVDSEHVTRPFYRSATVYAPQSLTRRNKKVFRVRIKMPEVDSKFEFDNGA
jgi:hypothetical protein